LPLVIINVQRGGPSTGLPTKTEQADLMQAYYGRNGEAPIPIVSASSPSDCFYMAYEACRLAVEHMTPVFFLSDGYMANGSEPWQYPTADSLPVFKAHFAKDNQEDFKPYRRDDRLVREWAIPGTAGLQHRIGGLEKEHETGNVSYDPDNHEFMVKIREEKVERIADFIPPLTFEEGKDKGKVLVLGWGSTKGAIKAAVREMIKEGYEVSHAQLNYIRPFPKNLGAILKSFDRVLIPEMNNGQLIRIIRDKFLEDAVGLNKIKGVPFTAAEIKEKIHELYKALQP
jgi:2-oxoglutarate ferredoxin oxidoreductase subunit alpha